MAIWPLYNDSTTNLAIGATFTGVARDSEQNGISLYNNFNAHFISDQASATNGARIEWSQDGSTNWRICGQTTLVASTPAILSVPVTFPFYRVILVNNGTTATTSLSITSSFTE